MAKKSSHDFSQPTRQSYVAILIITYNLYKVIVRNLIPLFIAFLIGGSAKSKGGYIFYSIMVIAGIAAIYSIIAFFKYYFYLKEDHIIVNKGVLRKTKLEIPFERIQSINFEQNVIHRLFGVVKLNMDTAGSAKEEVQLNALNIDLAKRLRSHILSNRVIAPTNESQEELQVEEDVREEIFRLSIPQLIKVGVTANHLRSGGLIIIFFFYIYDSLEDFGLNVVEKLEEYTPVFQQVARSLFIVLFLVVLFFIVSFFISIINTILRYYNLRMFRRGDGFVIDSGLFNRKQYAAKDSKIQMVGWSQNLLQGLARIYSIGLKQASSIENSLKSTFVAVGLSSQNISKIIDYLYGIRAEEFQSMDWQSVDRYYLFRRLYYSTVAAIIATIIIVFSQDWMDLIYVLVFFVVAVMASFLNYKKKKYGLSEHFLSVKGGTFGHSVELIEQYKIQSVSLTSTPFQRRRELASLRIMTASGLLQIPDIPSTIALRLKNRLIYTIEKSQADWM